MFTPRMLLKHGVALVLIATCCALAVWQGRRALDGNALSWAYTVEWPVFAGFVAIVWWREVRSQDDTPNMSDEEASAQPPPTPVPPPPRPPADQDEDPELAAYNAMLHDLNARSNT